MVFADRGQHGISCVILDVVSINYNSFPSRCCVVSHAQQDRDIDREVLEVERGEHEDCIEPGVFYSTFIPIVHKCFVLKDVAKGNLGDQREDKGERDNKKLLFLLLIVVRDPLLQPDYQHSQSEYVGDEDYAKECSYRIP